MTTATSRVAAADAPPPSQPPTFKPRGATFGLQVSADGRHLVDAHGRPFLINADTAWFVLDRLSTDDYDVYLDDRVGRGFNTVQIMAPWNYNVANFYGEPPFTRRADVSTPNEAYWKRVDTFLSKAAERALLVNIVPTWLGYTGDEWGAVLADNTLDACYEFGQFVGARYKKFDNVMWTIGGDYNPVPEALYDRENQIARGINDAASTQLISAHAHENQSSVDQYGTADWLTLNGTYTYFPDWFKTDACQVYELSKADYQRKPVRPFFLIESAYEDTPYDSGVVMPYMVRRQALWSVLSGSTGFAYGNVDIWRFNDSWHDALGDAGASQLGMIHRMLTDRPWHELVPDFDHTVVTAGYGTFHRHGEEAGDDYVTTARTKDGALVIAYLPMTGKQPRSLTVDMSRLSATATARWFNPVDGTYAESGTYEPAGSRQFTTPGDNGAGNNDWALIIETSPPTVF